MSRATLAVDRVAAVLVAAALVGAGTLALTWWFNLATWLPSRVDLAAAQDPTDRWWWPWAAAAGGIALITLALWWLAAHLPHRPLELLKLAGSNSTGRLQAAAAPVAQAAARSMLSTPGVRSCAGRVFQDRGQVLARLSATVDVSADLTAVTAAADRAASDLAAVLGRPDLHCNVHLKVARRSRSLRQVT